MKKRKDNIVKSKRTGDMAVHVPNLIGEPIINQANELSRGKLKNMNVCTLLRNTVALSESLCCGYEDEVDVS